MRFQIINRPLIATREDYDQAVNFYTDILKKIPGIHAVYQFGHARYPGISDLDLLAVFEEGATFSFNPLEKGPEKYRTLFTHAIQGISKAHLSGLMKFSYWHNYQLLYSVTGNDVLPGPSFEKADEDILKKQIATEFLTTNYIDFGIQYKMRIIKLRSLFQHVKGITYDFDFLGYRDQELNSMVENVKSWISEYYTDRVTDKEISEWFADFFPKFESFVNEAFAKNPLYLPERSYYRYARNIIVNRSDRVTCKKTGIVIPNTFKLDEKKHFRLQNRFNHYRFGFPITHEKPFKDAGFRISHSLLMRAYNKEHIPFFAPLITRFMHRL